MKRGIIFFILPKLRLEVAEGQDRKYDVAKFKLSINSAREEKNNSSLISS